MTQGCEIVAGAVPGANEDLVPVADVEDPGEDVASQLAERFTLEERCPDRQQRHHYEERRKEPSKTTDPETLHVD